MYLALSMVIKQQNLMAIVCKLDELASLQADLACKHTCPLVCSQNKGLCTKAAACVELGGTFQSQLVMLSNLNTKLKALLLPLAICITAF